MTDCKKVLVITFQFADNYGALLQAYALKRKIEDMGFYADIANYASLENIAEYSQNPFTVKGSIKEKVKCILKLPISYRQRKIFNEFRKKYLMLGTSISKDQLELVANSYDILITGSDQVWNGKITYNNTVYFLDFGNESVKRVSYAASFGTSYMTDFQMDCIKKYVTKYSAVSVREESSLSEIHKLIPNAVCVMDPVFFGMSSYWNELIDSVKWKNNSKYILYYSLGNDSSFDKIAEKISIEYGIQIIAIHPTFKIYHLKCKHLHNVGPIEFLSLIKNATIICSNSFHATCFSVIFGKKLCYKSNIDNPGRAESLLMQLHLIENSSVMQSDQYKMIDCAKVDKEILNREIANSELFLKESLQ